MRCSVAEVVRPCQTLDRQEHLPLPAKLWRVPLPENQAVMQHLPGSFFEISEPLKRVSEQ